MQFRGHETHASHIWRSQCDRPRRLLPCPANFRQIARRLGSWRAAKLDSLPRSVDFALPHYRTEDVPQSLFDAMGEFVGEAIKNGSVVDTAGLQPTAKGKRVRLSGGKITVIDGPFAETKEVVGGYALIEAKSYDEALALATRFMDLHRVHWPKFEGECEVRPLEAEPAQ